MRYVLTIAAAIVACSIPFAKAGDETTSPAPEIKAKTSQTRSVHRVALVCWNSLDEDGEFNKIGYARFQAVKRAFVALGIPETDVNELDVAKEEGGQGVFLGYVGGARNLERLVLGDVVYHVQWADLDNKSVPLRIADNAILFTGSVDVDERKSTEQVKAPLLTYLDSNLEPTKLTVALKKASKVKIKVTVASAETATTTRIVTTN